jgi:hypothetical protein
MSAPVQEHRLDNGLTLLTREVRRAPIVSFYVWYRVGSRNELPGVTGVSHWAEHMVFKGTDRFPKGVADKLVAQYGGARNGFTWLDYTAYYQTLPSEHVGLAIALEADRMAHSRFDPDEVAGERGVIISEREGNENHPGFYLSEELTAAAFNSTLTASRWSATSPTCAASRVTISGATTAPSMRRTTRSPSPWVISQPATFSSACRTSSERSSGARTRRRYGLASPNRKASGA